MLQLLSSKYTSGYLAPFPYPHQRIRMNGALTTGLFWVRLTQGFVINHLVNWSCQWLRGGSLTVAACFNFGRNTVAALCRGISVCSRWMRVKFRKKAATRWYSSERDHLLVNRRVSASICSPKPFKCVVELSNTIHFFSSIDPRKQYVNFYACFWNHKTTASYELWAKISIV